MSLLTTIPLLASLTGAAPSHALLAPDLGATRFPQHHLTLSMGSSSWDRSPVGESNEDGGEWYSRDGVGTYGLSYHTAQPGGIGLEIGILQGNTDGDNKFNISNLSGDIVNVPGNSSTESNETYIGALYVADTGSIRPYVGAGMTFIKADASYSYAGGAPDHLNSSGEVEGSGSTEGFYLHAGVNLVLDGNMTLGLDYRRVMGTDDIQFFDEGDFADDGVGMDSTTISVTLGFGF